MFLALAFGVNAVFLNALGGQVGFDCVSTLDRQLLVVSVGTCRVSVAHSDDHFKVDRFDFDKSVLKADGKAKLDDLVGKVKAINLEVIIAVGHTDSAGSDAYNQKLSVKRADAVKAYLITKGIEKNRVYTEGKGEKQPVADNKTDAGRSKNRRVEIEVVGTRPN